MNSNIFYDILDYRYERDHIIANCYDALKKWIWNKYQLNLIVRFKFKIIKYINLKFIFFKACGS